MNIKLIGVVVCVALTSSLAHGDDSLKRYFDQLRHRSLFALAETEAISRLANEKLSFAARTEIAIELSQTLAEHAGYVSDDQQAELWHRAQETVRELADQNSSHPRTIQLQAQFAFVLVIEGDWRRTEIEVRPFDETLRKQAILACSQAIERLNSLDTQLSEPGQDAANKRPVKDAMSSYERRVLLHQVRWNLALAYRNRAELAVAGSNDRKADLTEAEALLRRLQGIAEEPIQTQSRLLLIVCQRLKNDRERAFDAVVALDKIESKPDESIGFEIVAEQIQLLLELNRPTDAAKLLLKTRNEQKRLTGQLWYLQVKVLISLRAVAVEKSDETLTNRLNDQILTTIIRCEDQVGGFWSRRCRQLWDNARTVQQYGEALDTLMQKARADYTAKRYEQAIEKYTTAEKSAIEAEQRDLAMELGFTKASILLEQSQFELAATEFFRLSTDYPTHVRTAKSHLLGAYCLGRLYDYEKTDSHRDSYLNALNRHLQIYPADVTVNDACLLKAQFEEQSQHANEALPLYLQVDSKHDRALEAIFGAARCYETILRRKAEQRFPSGDLELEAIKRLTNFLATGGESIEGWTITHADVAIRLAAILLINTAETNITDDPKSAQPKSSQAAAETRISERCQKAEEWLLRVIAFSKSSKLDATKDDEKERLRQRTIPLFVVAMVGQGEIPEAERMLKAASLSSNQLLLIINELTTFSTSFPNNQRIRIALFQLKLIDQLNTTRDQLSANERLGLDLCSIKTNQVAGQTTKSMEIARQLSASNPKDRDLQRELANLLAEMDLPDATSAAKECWRRIESLTKPGSSEWMTARIAVLQICLRQKQYDEGRKLLQVTKVLYPDLGGPILKAQFETIEADYRKDKSGTK